MVPRWDADCFFLEPRRHVSSVVNQTGWKSLRFVRLQALYQLFVQSLQIRASLGEDLLPLRPWKVIPAEPDFAFCLLHPISRRSDPIQPFNRAMQVRFRSKDGWRKRCESAHVAVFPECDISNLFAARFGVRQTPEGQLEHVDQREHSGGIRRGRLLLMPKLFAGDFREILRQADVPCSDPYQHKSQEDRDDGCDCVYRFRVLVQPSQHRPIVRKIPALSSAPPMPDRDARVRLAAFACLDAQTQLHGDTLVRDPARSTKRR